MIVYEVIKPFSIDYSNNDSIYLDLGDFLFLESGYWGNVRLTNLFTDKMSSIYVETYVLKKILYKGGDVKKDECGEIYFDECWKEIEDINLFNPLIDNKFTIKESLNTMIIESLAWKRVDKLKELGI